jgi:hypothetical protein
LEIKEKTTSLATNGHMIGLLVKHTNGKGWLDHPTNWYYRNDSTVVNNSTAPVMNTYHRYILAVLIQHRYISLLMFMIQMQIIGFPEH